MLALPGGARGRALGRGALAPAMSGLACWRSIGGISDGLLVAAGEPQPTAFRPRHPSGIACCPPGPARSAGWSSPTGSPAELEWLADETARGERLATGMADRFPDRDVEARLVLRTGTPSCARDCRPACGVSICSRAAPIRRPLAGGPPRVRVGRSQGPAVYARAGRSPAVLRDPLGRPGTESATGPQNSFHASTGLLAALTRSPDAEIPGIRLALRPDFDVTPETPAVAQDAEPPVLAAAPATGAASPAERPDGGWHESTVPLGQVLDRQRMPAGPLRVPLGSLNRHVFVCGATGGGKSQTVRGLLEAATRAGVPWLVVEPAKAEYRLMAARLAGSGAQVVRIRPGEADAVAAGLNPLEPAADQTGERFPLQTHADLVRALFLAAFQSEEPFPQVLSAALTRVYEDAGWDLALGEPLTPGVTPGYPGLADLQRTAEQVVGEIGYSDEVRADVLGFIKVRLSSLRLGTSGRFLEGGHPVDFGQLLRHNTVLEIEDVGDDRDKAFLMGTVLLRLVEQLRLARRHEAGAEPGLRHLTVVEEAHRLLRRPERDAGVAAHAVELFAGLLAEIRAYGEGIVIAEQIPAKLIPDVIKNTAVKIVHRLPAADDREAVGATMNLSRAQSQYLVTLAPGEAAVSVDGMDHPLLARMPDGTAREAAGGTAGTASPAAVTAARSGTCGADCIGRPCTLRDMRAAQRALDRHPGIALWAEIAVLSHLTGWPMPIPRAPLLDLLRALPARLRDCALSHGVDAAVAARTPLICARVSPPALASHVATAMRARVTRGMWMCPQEEPAWLAPAYQWVLLLDALTAGDPAQDGRGPAARIRNWPDALTRDREGSYGRAIPGDTRARQAATVQRWHDSGLRDADAVRAVAFGLVTPSAIERAIGASAADDDFGPRLADHLEQFADCEWPHLYLKRRAEPEPVT